MGSGVGGEQGGRGLAMKESVGRYRIHAVAEATGVPAATLRAWERRYGIPAPVRTTSAYRLYTEDDMLAARRMRELTEAGLAISEAARLVRIDLETPAPQPAPLPPEGADVRARALEHLVAAVSEGDPVAVAREAVRGAFLGNGWETFHDVYAPAMARAEALRREGRLEAAKYALAAGTLENATRGLLRIVQPAAPRWRVLLACIAGERDVTTLHGAGIAMASWGVRSVELGGDASPRAVEDSLVRADADGVLFCLGTEGADPRERLARYAKVCDGRACFVVGAGASSAAAWVRANGGVPVVGSIDAHRAEIEAELGASARSRTG